MLLNKTLSKILCYLLSAAIFVAALVFIPGGDIDPMLGDFSAFYTGALLVKDRCGEKLYDLDTQKHLQRRVVSPLTSPDVFLPYVHPPYEALLFVPLTYFSPRRAYWIWIGINILILVLALSLLARYLPAPLPPVIWLMAALFFPVYIALFNGQDSILTLLLFTLVFTRWKSRRYYQAGMLSALVLYKFQLLLPLMAVFIWEWRAPMLRGFLAVAFLLAGISLAITGVAGVESYFRLLLMYGAHPSAMTIYSIKADVMMNLRGFFLRLLGDNPVPVHWAVLIASLGWLGLLVRRWRYDAAPSFDLQFAFLIVVSLLVSYHLHLQDHTLLLLALALILNYLYRRFDKRNGRPVDRATGLLAATAFLLANPFIHLLSAAYPRMNLVALLLLLLAGLLYHELGRLRGPRRKSYGTHSNPGPHPAQTPDPGL